MSQPRQQDLAIDRFFMFFSAVLFAYFGYFASLTATAVDGQYVVFYDILLWTLRIGAIGFIVSFVLSFVAPRASDLLYALFGLGTSIALVVVAFMDIADTSYIAAIPPFWAFVFAAWNGYGSGMALRDLLAARRAAQTLETPEQTPPQP